MNIQIVMYVRGELSKTKIIKNMRVIYIVHYPAHEGAYSQVGYMHRIQKDGRRNNYADKE